MGPRFLATLAFSLALAGSPGDSSAAERDPWQVRRDPSVAARERRIDALVAGAEDEEAPARLRARLSPEELERSLAILRARLSRRAGYRESLAVAQLLVASGKAGEALGEIDRVEKATPGRPASARLRALALAALGRGGEAGALLETLAEKTSAAPARARLLGQAAELSAAIDPAAAERRLRGAIEAATTAGSQRLGLLERSCAIALRLGRGASCADRLAEVAGSRPGDRAAALRAEADLREALGDYPRAVAAWQSLLDAGGSVDRQDAALARMLVLLDRLGRRSDLEQIFARLARGGARNQAVLLAAVERAYDRGDRALGEKLFDHAQRGLRRSPAALAKLADIASRFNDHPRVLHSWQAVLALDPRSESAIVALGETHFQAGRRELARDSWRRLERVIRPAAAAHARLAELFGDHDMLPEAMEEARKAQRLERDNVQHHRILARILERKRDNPGAISEWRAVLSGSRGPELAAARKEARLRLVSLIAREGRERLRAETVQLKDRARRHPEERETALYLAELQLRLGLPGEAVDTLTATAEELPRDPEIVLMLVQLLRQSKQTIRALSRLERFVEDAPERASETWLRIAALRAERYEDAAALAAVGRALAAPAPTGADAGSPELLIRAAEVEEGLGQTAAALTHFQRALDSGGGAKAAAGVARLRALAGDSPGAVAALSSARPHAEWVERMLPIWSYADSASGLLSVLESTGASAEGAPGKFLLEERGLLEALATEVRSLHERAGRDPAASKKLAGLSRSAARPLYELLLEPGRDSTQIAVAAETLGMLGNADATPALAQLVESAPLEEASAPSSGSPSAPVSATETAKAAAVVALGRIGSDRAVPALVPLTRASSPELRAAAVWALARLPGPAAAEALAGAARDPRADVAALAWLGLGQHRRLAADETLRVLRDPASPVVLRRAAAVGGARAGLEGLGGPLTDLLPAAEPGLADCAATGLRVLRLERTAAVWRQALLGEGSGRQQATRLLSSPTDARLADDAQVVGSGPTPVEASRVLDGVCAPPVHADAAATASASSGVGLETPWREQPTLVADVLAPALLDGGDHAWRALEALERLLPATGRAGARAATRPNPPAGEPIPTLSARLAGPLAARLADPELRVRLAAARAAARLGTPAIEVRHLLDALAATAPERRPGAGPVDPEETAELLAAALQVSGHLHEAAGRLAELLSHPAWQTRRAVVRALVAGNALTVGLERRIASDASPLVRAALAAGALPRAERSGPNQRPAP